MNAASNRSILAITSCFFVILSAQAHPDDGCYAGESPLCSPSVPACVYRAYSSGGAFTEGPDADADGWQDGCDAFPTDASEWADLDGDSAGHNADCNDRDPSLQECGPADSNEATASEGTADDSRGSASPIFSKATRVLRPVPCRPYWECGPWSDCADGGMTRACRDAWACQTDEEKPETAMACPIEDAVSTEPLPPASAESDPEASFAPAPAAVLSGLVVPSESWWTLIAATLVLILAGAFRKRA